MTLARALRRGAVRAVSPGWFRGHVLPAYRGTWDAAEAAMLADPNEARLLRELSGELAEHGIQRPVSVFFEHWWRDVKRRFRRRRRGSYANASARASLLPHSPRNTV
jgi:hypothetical protein